MLGTRLGNFEIIEELGRGGMGVVYRARQVSLDRVVALKVLPARFAADSAAAQRFEREAQAMAQLQHPNIVDVIEVGEEGDLQYFAMKFVEGESLEEIIKRDGPLDPERAADIAAQVADALQHAHERGVVHRDIKPANILVTANGRAVVTDFGIAKAIEGLTLAAGGSLTQGVIGTPEYMSPEVIRGNPIDGRTDLYSLAIVIYQMLTGHVPFTATTPYAIAELHLQRQPTPPTSAGCECPAWLESIILRGMMKEPSQRFTSAAEMAAALRARAVVALPQPTTVSAGPTLQSSQPTVEWGGHSAAVRAHVPGFVWALVGAGVLLLAAALVMMAMRSQGTTIPPPPEVEVPELLGMTLSAAQQKAEVVGLDLLDDDRRYDDTAPKDVVIDQVPAAGTKVAAGDTVRVTVSDGPVPKQEVPYVTGLETSDAESNLRSLGFSVEYDARRFSSDYAAGKVMQQTPSGGSAVSPGSTVHLTVSDGPEPQKTVRELLVGSWGRTHLDGKRKPVGGFIFRSDGTATYRESGKSDGAHRWTLSDESGRPVLTFTSTGNSYYIDQIDGSTMKWTARRSGELMSTTQFERR